MDGKRKDGKWIEKAEKIQKISNKVKAVMFVQHTPFSELAKRLRKAEEKLEDLTGYRIKIVERAGSKLKDLIHSSNPRSGKLCERLDCLLCKSKIKLGKSLKQCCRKRNLVYEIWCWDCKERMEDDIDEMEIDEDLKKKKKDAIRVPKYIGESSRSIYERTYEHTEAMRKISSKSFMVKH